MRHSCIFFYIGISQSWSLRHPHGSGLLCSVTQRQILSSPWPPLMRSLKIIQHEGSDMANYWLDLMTMVEVLMLNVHAVHTCNWEEYLMSLRDMPWLVIYDQTNDGRWLSGFWVMLSSLPADQTQFLSSNFAKSITGNQCSSIPWDMWIEMTMNKGSKMKAGWMSILRNVKQLMADTRNSNNLGRIRAILHTQGTQKKLSRKHSECAPLR